MKFRAIDSTGDWTLGAGKANYATDERAIELNVLTRLRAWKNDCFFDLDAGIDWLARLDKNQKENLINEIKILLIQTYGVMKVYDVVLVEDRRTRAISLTYTIDTIFSKNFTRAVALLSGATES
jgi:hypothetical protein